MEIQSLKAATREAAGKQTVRKVRATGALPGVLYGGGEEPVSLVMNRREFETAVQHSRGGEHAILQLEVEDKPELSTAVLLKDVQHHPLRGEFVHADFLRIRMDEQIVTLVAVRLDGQAPGIVEGGMLEHQVREIEIECRAMDVPDEFVADVSALHINDSVYVKDMALPENVRLITDAELPVATVHPPRVVKDEVAGEAAEGEGEPEVIGEKTQKE